MNFTESFTNFSSKLTPTDLALYAGAGLLVWVLFKDRLSPVQELILGIVNKAKSLLATGSPRQVSVVASNKGTDDVFFRLVNSWKQTRDLAVESGCDEAVKVADQMFPFLSPNVCNKQPKE